MKYPAYPRYKPSGIDWLGDVPEHWDVKRLKTVAQLINQKIEIDEEIPFPYVGMENIESWTGKLQPLNDNLVPSGVSSFFKSGSTLFGKLRPYLAKACNVGFDGICSSELLVLKSYGISRRFLLYSLLCEGFISLVNSSTYGAKMPRSSWEFIGNCVIPIAPEDEQFTIADFLDAQTARLDTLVAKKRELIEKLKEKRTALISRTVTHGLPPDAARAAGFNPHPKLKPSGINWLGDVPEHWATLKTKFCYSIQLGKMLQPEATDENDIEVSYLKAQHVQWERVNVSDLPTMWANKTDCAKYAVKDGDLLVCEGGDVGRAGIVRCPPIGMIIQNALHRVRPKADNELRFLMYLLELAASLGWFEIICNRATIAHFTSDKFGALRIPLPPLPEQCAIADFLDRETARIDRMIKKIGEAIDKLQEYRSALITAAVTGKIDVQGAAI